MFLKWIGLRYDFFTQKLRILLDWTLLHVLDWTGKEYCCYLFFEQKVLTWITARGLIKLEFANRISSLNVSIEPLISISMAFWLQCLWILIDFHGFSVLAKNEMVSMDRPPLVVREGSRYQIGWFFGKIPNGIWPPPSFSKNYVANFA